MTDYSLGKIYKLYAVGLEDACYIGSTTRSLAYRLGVHKAQNKPGQNKCASAALFEEGNEVVIELLEDFSCETKQQLEARERYWIEQFPDCINKNIPTRTWIERHMDNREKNLAYMKQYKQEHKEEMKAYQEANKDKRRAQELERYANGYGEVRNQRKKEKVECPECKKVMNKNSLWEHKWRIHGEAKPQRVGGS